MNDDATKIRNGRPDDAQSLARIFAAAWHGAYVGIIPDIDIRRMITSRREPYWRNFLEHSGGLLVVEVNNTIAGYVTLGPARTRGAFEGEIYELYVAPEYQGLGLGERLFETARLRLEESGKRGMIVWALSDNTGAQIFYERRGGEPKGETHQKFSSKTLSKTAFAFA